MGPKKSDKKGGKAKAKGGADGEVQGEDPLQFLQNYTRFSKLIGVAPNPKVVAQLQSDENQPLTQASSLVQSTYVHDTSTTYFNNTTYCMYVLSYRDIGLFSLWSFLRVPDTWYVVFLTKYLVPSSISSAPPPNNDKCYHCCTGMYVRTYLLVFFVRSNQSV